MAPERNALLIAFIVISVLAAAAYGGTLRNGIVWDDETFIANNAFVHDLSRFPQYFTNAASISEEPGMQLMYRPVQTLSYALDTRLWGDWVGGYHLTSLLLHIASCMAIVFAFRSLIGFAPAVAAACIFSVHPALSEGVLSLASRGNQLYTLFGLLSLGFFLRVKKVFDRDHISSIAAMAVALFSKEPAIALVVLLPLFQAYAARPWKINEKRSRALLAPFLAAAFLYLLVRALVVGSAKAAAYWGGSLWATLMMQSKVFVVYLRLLVWPFHLKGRYSIASPAPFPDPLVIGAVLLTLLIVALGVLAYRRGGRGKLIALAIAWFYISLAPVSNIIPIPGSMMGERFVYFTFAGVLPLLAGALRIEKGSMVQKAAIILGAGIFAAFIATDLSRTSLWENNGKFFTLLSRQEPHDHAVQIRMAQEEIETGKTSSALSRIEHILHGGITSSLTDGQMQPHYWYGRALLDSGRFSEAYREFAIVVTMSPKSFKDVSLFLAEAAARSGNIAEARRLLEHEAASSPDNDNVWNGLGNIQLMTADLPAAISSYRRALTINPKNEQAAANLTYALQATGQAPKLR